MTINLSYKPNRTSMEDIRNIYEESLQQLKDIFPDWEENDLLTLLSEFGGDLELVVQRISEGHVMHWAEIGKKVPVRKEDITPVSIRQNVENSHFNKNKKHHQRENRSRVEVPQQHQQQQQPQKSSSSSISADKRTPKPHKDNVPIYGLVAGKDESRETTPNVTVDMAPAETVENKEKAQERTAVKRYTSIKGKQQGQKNSNNTLSNVPKNDDESIGEMVDLRKEIVSSTVNSLFAAIANEASLSELVSAIVEEEVNGFIATGQNNNVSMDESLANSIIPVVQMPQKPSSRIINSNALQQPVVVMPRKATVRPGLAVNFGEVPKQQLTTTTTFDPMIISNPKTNSIESTRYMSSSVETSLISSQLLEDTVVMAEAANTRRNVGINQPIQRPGNFQARDSYMTPPPGLIIQETDYTNPHGAVPKNNSSRFVGNNPNSNLSFNNQGLAGISDNVQSNVYGHYHPSRNHQQQFLHVQPPQPLPLPQQQQQQPIPHQLHNPYGRASLELGKSSGNNLSDQSVFSNSSRSGLFQHPQQQQQQPLTQPHQWSSYVDNHGSGMNANSSSTGVPEYYPNTHYAQHIYEPMSNSNYHHQQPHHHHHFQSHHNGRYMTSPSNMYGGGGAGAGNNAFYSNASMEPAHHQSFRGPYSHSKAHL